MHDADFYAALKSVIRKELAECQSAIQRDDKRRALTELEDARRKIQQLLDEMV